MYYKITLLNFRIYLEDLQELKVNVVKKVIKVIEEIKVKEVIKVIEDYQEEMETLFK